MTVKGILAKIGKVEEELDFLHTELAAAIVSNLSENLGPFGKVTLSLLLDELLKEGGPASTPTLADYVQRSGFPTESGDLINLIGTTLRQNKKRFKFDTARRVWERKSG